MTEQKASWVNMKSEDVEKKVIQLAKEGNSPERIGIMLRDEHGIPKVRFFGKRIKHILKKANIWEDSERQNQVKKIGKLEAHVKKNGHDYTAKKSLLKRARSINK